MRSKERGQAMVEFLLSAIFVFILIFGMVQTIVIVYAFVEMAQAAKAGVRYAIVHGSRSGLPSTEANPTGVKNAVINYSRILSGCSATCIEVDYLDADSNAAPNRVRVRVTYPFTMLGLGWTLPTIRASAVGRITF